jgi:ADP-ribose pyrophosphatase YjhB (NUDIX family)
MMRTLLRVWGRFPVWVHTLASLILRPRFQLAVAALVFSAQGQVLLFRHTYRKFPWGIPAGSLEYGEQPWDAVICEFH